MEISILSPNTQNIGHRVGRGKCAYEVSVLIANLRHLKLIFAKSVSPTLKSMSSTPSCQVLVFLC